MDENASTFNLSNGNNNSALLLSYEDRIRFIEHLVYSNFYIVFGQKYTYPFCKFIIKLIHLTYVSPIFEEGRFIGLIWNQDDKYFKELICYLYQHRCVPSSRQADYAGALSCLFKQRHASQYISILKYYHPKSLPVIFSDIQNIMDL